MSQINHFYVFVVDRGASGEEEEWKVAFKAISDRNKNCHEACPCPYEMHFKILFYGSFLGELWKDVDIIKHQQQKAGTKRVGSESDSSWAGRAMAAKPSINNSTTIPFHSEPNNGTKTLNSSFRNEKSVYDVFGWAGWLVKFNYISSGTQTFVCEWLRTFRWFMTPDSSHTRPSILYRAPRSETNLRQKIIIRESLKIIYGEEELDFVLLLIIY